ncbi:hypothetical protein DSL72_007319 [Monilinia vaccinii-corymbosi]|uniref:Uncharacterized protein n=1 Tax=Monilinia vaccinii-corymbosi TaxID=61207 RepID=A0A8A3PMP8_9HELO|nr:hypothetical protein DSL72_007319 [Monilinia vaccinii-corymbosi]
MDNIYREIGNAVPIPLARALGNELWKVLQKHSMTADDTDHNQEMDDQVDIGVKDTFEQNVDAEQECIAINHNKNKNSEEEMDDEDIELEDDIDQSLDYSDVELMVIMAIDESNQDVVMIDEEDAELSPRVEGTEQSSDEAEKFMDSSVMMRKGRKGMNETWREQV